MDNTIDKIDPRIVRFSLDIKGRRKTYENLYIKASGTKFSNFCQAQCEVQIANLDDETVNYLLTQSSPYIPLRRPTLFTLEAGRESYGYAKIYQGIVCASGGVSQPPDIMVTLHSLTANDAKNIIVAQSLPGVNPLSAVSKSIASSIGVGLNFEATDRNVGDYSYTGPAINQVGKLGAYGGVNAFIDDDMLVVKDMLVPRGGVTREVNEDTGMIGTPETTDLGIKVKFLLDRSTRVGGAIALKSKLSKALNGNYLIYKLSFDISNRELPFYWIAECRRML